MKTIIRLNKVLRELNISLKQAIEFLSSKGEKIEARPTNEITETQYQLLLKEFTTSQNKKKSKKTPNYDLVSEDILKTFKISSDYLIKSINKNLEIENEEELSINKSIQNLYKALQNKELVLGAGASFDFGIPTWDVLLQKLMALTIKSDKKSTKNLSDLYNKHLKPTPLISGRYLQNHYEQNNSSFENKVRNVLYEKVDKTFKSELMEEIIKLCTPNNKHSSFNSIITYNFDDILEYKLDQSEFKILYKSVYGFGMDIRNIELPIYHVHGFLPQNKKLDKLNTITFGESNYHHQYSDVYSWNNIVQINKFRENTCIFIGTSLTDPNIRRLLDIANKQKVYNKKFHYILMVKENKSKLTEKINLTDSPKDQKITDSLLNMHEQFMENDFSSFGLKTIWLNNYNEIPSILKSIRENKI